MNGEEGIEHEEGEDGEELYELVPNGEASDVSSEAEEKSEMPDCKDTNAASWQTEAAPNFQRSIIEDIRSALIISSFTIIFRHIVLDWREWTIPFVFFTLTGSTSLVLVRSWMQKARSWYKSNRRDWAEA